MYNGVNASGLHRYPHQSLLSRRSSLDVSGTPLAGDSVSDDSLRVPLRLLCLSDVFLVVAGVC